MEGFESDLEAMETSLPSSNERSFFELCKPENLATVEGRVELYNKIWHRERIQAGMEVELFGETFGFPPPNELVGNGFLADDVNLAALLARPGEAVQFGGGSGGTVGLSEREVTLRALEYLDNDKIMDLIIAGMMTMKELKEIVREAAREAAHKVAPASLQEPRQAPNEIQSAQRKAIRPIPMPIRDFASYRDARDRAAKAAAGSYYYGLYDLIQQARQTRDTDLERACWDVADKLDNDGQGEWVDTLQGMLEERPEVIAHTRPAGI